MKVNLTEEIIQYLHPKLVYLDYENGSTRAYVIAVAIVSHLALILFLHQLVKMATASRTDVSTTCKILSSFQLSRAPFGVLMSCIAVFTLLFPSPMSRDYVAGRNNTAIFLVLIAFAFHVTDTAVLVISACFFNFFSKTFLLHHVTTGIVYSAILITDTGYTFGCHFMLVETIVPFLTARIVMHILNRKRLLRPGWSIVYKCNEFFVIHLMHMRQGFEIYLLYRMYDNFVHVRSRMPLPVTVLICAQLGIMLFLVPYWAYKATVNSAFVSEGIFGGQQQGNRDGSDDRKKSE